MTNQQNIIWVRFTQDIIGDKLQWIAEQLEASGIAHRRHGSGFRGPIIQVDESRLAAAHAIMGRKVGEFIVGTTTINITVDDLPSDHEFFTNELSQPNESQKFVDPNKDIWTASVESAMEQAKDMHDAIAGADVARLEDDWDFDDEPDKSMLIEGNELEHEIVKLALDDGKEYEIPFFMVQSSNMSQMSHIVNKENSEDGMFYVRFKGGPTIYRYLPVSEGIWDLLYAEAVKAQRMEPDASLGALFHALIKKNAEDDASPVKCERLDGTRWVEVLPRAKRVKNIAANHNK